MHGIRLWAWYRVSALGSEVQWNTSLVNWWTRDTLEGWSHRIFSLVFVTFRYLSNINIKWFSTDFFSFWLGPFSENPTPRLKKKTLKPLISICWKLRKVQLLPNRNILHGRLYSGGYKLTPHHKKRPSMNEWVNKLYFDTVVISRYKIGFQIQAWAVLWPNTNYITMFKTIVTNTKSRWNILVFI